MKMEVVEFKYKDRFKPVQLARYPVPYHYQERLATHLRKLEAEGMVERVNLAEPIDCILNNAVTPGQSHLRCFRGSSVFTPSDYSRQRSEARPNPGWLA